jgi:hypothetical protein
MSRRTAAWLAWSLWGLSLILTVVALMLLALIRSHPNAHVFDWWVSTTLTVIDVTVGALLVSRRPKNPIGWLLLLGGLAICINHFSAQYAIYALLAQPGSLPAGKAMAWISSWLLPVYSGLQVLYLLLFPTGQLPSSRWRWVAWLSVAYISMGVILSAFSSGAYLGSLGPIRNPLGIEGFTDVYTALLYTVAPLLYVAATLSVFMRLRQAVGVERQQIKWFAYSAALFAIGVVLIVIPLAIDTPPWYRGAATALFAAISPAIPISIGIAILRYRLYEIDLLINRTLVYASLTAILVAVYFGAVVLLQRLFVALSGEKSTLAVVTSTLVIAALFNPLRRRVQVFVDQRFYRRKYDAAKTLEAFNARLRDKTDLDALNSELVGVVRDTMQPAHVSLWLRPLTGVGRRRESPQ